jgi:uncharacterized Zn-binding protein involved in type VI secretion
VPAARRADPTSHGGTIIVGSPTVLIGGSPAARVGDQVVCPGVTAVVPHVGGPIISGSVTVLINGQRAARVGDTHAEVGPGGQIVAGEPTVLIGP